jgi:hypothetical protein
MNMSLLQIVTTPDTLNSALETWFIQNNLLGGIPYSQGFDPKKIHNSVVVYLELGEINVELIQTLKSAENKVALFHMGDELANKNIAPYALCDLVIRNYYFPHIISNVSQSPKIIWAPNGFRTGVGPRAILKLKLADKRQALAAFLGWINNSASYNGERASFAKAASMCGENLFVMPSNGFAAGYNVGLYSAILEDSIFAPCPAGNSPETIRLYDALETGAIPISLKHDFLISKDALASIGPVPFPIIESWTQLPFYLEKMRIAIDSEPLKIIQLQAECIDWWSRYKKMISSRLLNELNRI